MRAKFRMNVEARVTNDEKNTNAQMKNLRIETLGSIIQISSFLRASSLVIRHSRT
jgi:hypothetical protein